MQVRTMREVLDFLGLEPDEKTVRSVTFDTEGITVVRLALDEAGRVQMDEEHGGVAVTTERTNYAL